ncbi:MAG: hypothetical protein ACPGJV_07815 [Bacteriovoracaceae bacterium]
MKKLLSLTMLIMLGTSQTGFSCPNDGQFQTLNRGGNEKAQVVAQLKACKGKTTPECDAVRSKAKSLGLSG